MTKEISIILDSMKPKQYKCKHCGNKYQKSNSIQTWCSYDCAVQIAKKKVSKEKERERKEKRREWQQKKQAWKSELTTKIDPLQKTINSIARLIDKDEPCIARPFEKTQHYDAGHIFSVGSHPALRYNLWNVHKQGVKSNRDKGGEQHLMFEGIEIRYGKEVLEMVMSLPKVYPVLKLTNDEKKEALKRANKLLRELQAGRKVTRDEANEIISIYV